MDIPDYMHGNIQDILSCEFDAAYRRAQWAVVLGLKPFKDGDQWCVLYGGDLQDGIAAFGETPEKAIYNFDEAMRTK